MLEVPNPNYNHIVIIFITRLQALQVTIGVFVYSFLRNKISQAQTGPKGVFYFGHSANVFSAIVRLGFARDATPLLSSNFDEMRNRKWKSSYLSPFASNVMAVLYDCHGANKVTFFVNQVPMTVEKYGCTLCPWQSIDAMFGPIVSSPSCTFDEHSGVPRTAVNGVLLLVVIGCSFNVLFYFYYRTSL